MGPKRTAGGASVFQTKSFNPSSFSARSWRLSDVVDSAITVYNVVRTYVTTIMKRTAIRAGKRTITITEGATR